MQEIDNADNFVPQSAPPSTHQSAPQSPVQTPSPQPRGIPIPISRPYATYALLAAIVIVYVGQMVIDQTSETGTNALVEFGVLWPYGVYHGDFYRLLTNLFLHGGIAHLAFNCYALWIFGKLVEGFFGHARFLLIYFVAGLFGSIAELLILQAALGASGAIFGIFGAQMVFLYQNRQVFGTRATQELRSLVFLALLNLGFGVFSQIAPGAVKIGLGAHVGGFVAGAALAWLIAPRYALATDSLTPRVVDLVPQRQVWIAAALSAVAVIIGYIASMIVMQKAF